MTSTDPSRDATAARASLVRGVHRVATSLAPTSPVVRRALRHRALAWAVVLGSAALVHHQLREADAVRRDWGEAVHVVVVARPVARGDLIAPGALTRRTLPRSAVPDGATAAVPRGGRAAVDLATGQVLTASLVDGARRGATAEALPVGTLGVVVSTGGLHPPVDAGDRVDVVSGSVDPDGTGGAAPLLARDAVVLRRDDDRVTLAVPDDRAAVVAAAALAGPVALVITR